MVRYSKKNILAMAPPALVAVVVFSGCNQGPEFSAIKLPVKADILSPASNTHYYEGQVVHVSGQAYDENRGGLDTLEELVVTVQLDGKEVASTRPAEDGTVAVDIPTLGLEVNAPLILEMIATRVGNDLYETDEIVFYVDANQAPEGSILTPSADQHLYSDSKVQVNVQVSDYESLYIDIQARLYVDGLLLSPEPMVLSVGSNYHEGSGSEWVQLPEGIDQMLGLEITDEHGKTVWVEQLIDVGPPNSAPGPCAILFPTASDEIYSEQEITLRGSTSDEDQDPSSLSYSWYDGQYLIASGSPTASGSIVTLIPDGFPSGSHALNLIVTDEMGERCEAEQPFSVLAQNAAPEVEILYPDEGGSGATVNAEQVFQLNVQVRDTEDAANLRLWLTYLGDRIEGQTCDVAATGTTGQGQNTIDYICYVAAANLAASSTDTVKATVYAVSEDSKGASGSDYVVLEISPCVDLDEDGYTNCQESGCDDNINVNPSRTETCDGVDNDCDGIVDGDAVDLVTFFRDSDADTYGSPSSTQSACSPPTGFVANDDDCNDNDEHAYPGNGEICGDNIDNDCDGFIDENFDSDNDGFRSCDGDCNDARSDTYPGAPELCDGIDNNCDGILPSDEQDSDGDSYPECEEGWCDDDPGRNPGMEEICNGIDDDCDGIIPDDELEDEDADGYVDCEEEGCYDDPTRNPGMNEVCNGIDDDCDGDIDEGMDADLDSYLPCGENSDCDDQNASIYPGAPEVCDGIDSNCDGLYDTEVAFDQDRDGVAACLGDCNDTDPEVNPHMEEIFDGVDNDCNGEKDDFLIESFAQVSYEGASYKQLAGWSLAGVGDVNADGLSDFVVGIPGTQIDGLSSVGRALLYTSNGAMPEVQHDIFTTTNATGWLDGSLQRDELGKAVAGIGDVDGDGISDFAIGAPFNRKPGGGSPTSSGSTYVIFGCNSTADCLSGDLEASVGVTVLGATESEHSGSTIASAGDINCDGLDDLVIAAPDHSYESMEKGGRVYAIFGRARTDWPTEVSLTNADIIFEAEEEFSHVGASLTSHRGDLNHDGCDDLVLGAPSESGEPRVYVFHGRDTWTWSQPPIMSVGSASVVLAGDSATRAGTAVLLSDLDGDGVSDLVVGAPQAGQKAQGRSYIVFGSPNWAVSSQLDLEGRADLTIEGGDQPEAFGSSLAAGGDFNGDGFADLTIGAPTWSTPDYTGAYTYLGRAYVFYGGQRDLLDWYFASDSNCAFGGGTPGYESDPANDPMNSDQVGATVAFIGDFYTNINDGISRAEILVSTPYFDSGGSDVGKVYMVAFE